MAVSITISRLNSWKVDFVEGGLFEDFDAAGRVDGLCWGNGSLCLKRSRKDDDARRRTQEVLKKYCCLSSLKSDA